MVFLFLLFLSFPPDWEEFERGLIFEKEDPQKAIEIYKKLETSQGLVGILANYKLVLFDEENSYKWFLKILKKNSPKNMIEECYKILIERNEKNAIENFENFNMRFSNKFRKKIEEKILLIRFQNTKDKISFLLEVIKKNDLAAISISKFLFKENIKIPKNYLMEIFKIGLKLRDLNFCQDILDMGLDIKNLRKNEIFLLGRYYFFKKDYQKSFEYFDKLKDENFLFHKARVLLFLNEEEKAIEVLKQIKNDLYSQAQYLILRIKLKNGKIDIAREILKNIKNIKIKRDAILNLAIHYNFYAEKKEANELLNSIQENYEIKFWKQRINDKIQLNFNPEYAPFNYFFLDKFPEFQNNKMEFDFNFKPVNFPQFLISKGYFKEGLFFQNTLKFQPIYLAKILINQEKYKEAINLIYSEAIKTLKDSPEKWNTEILKIYFPRAYEEKLKNLCKDYGVPLNLFWAIMRQESLFEKDAISSQGAIGLMQVLPQNYLKYEEDLENPFEFEKNVKVSLKYLKSLKEIFGDWVYVIASYNAGEEAVSLWLKDPITIDLPSFYSTIPYKETKVYTRNVLYNWMVYKILYGEEYEKN